MIKKELKMTFDPKTIEHLGIKMYSSFHAALAELIANAYDANAKEVKIDIIDHDEKRIVVHDDGDGMTFDEVNAKFLVIGRNRRIDENTNRTSSGRKIMGRKGLGKLSLFGLGNSVTIETKNESENKKLEFYLNWDELKKDFSNKEYKPKFKEYNVMDSKHGTKITLSNLSRKKKFNIEFIKNKLIQMFNGIDKDFKVFISYNYSEYQKLDEKDKYINIDKQFEWDFKSFISEKMTDNRYVNKTFINGKIFASKLPLPAQQRGITIFANGRMANEPSFFNPHLESNFFFSYITGWITIDFIDEGLDEIISTSRQNINWDNENIDGLQEFLHEFIKELENDWRIKRKEVKRKELSEKTGIDVKNWTSTMPKDLGDKIEKIIEDIVEDDGIEQKTTNSTVKKIHEIIPEYPFFHWRHLHPTIHSTSGKEYKSQNYYAAFFEAFKKYINAIREKTALAVTEEETLLNSSFGIHNNPTCLTVTGKYKMKDGKSFPNKTIENIEEGQKSLSVGVLKAARHPIGHIEVNELRDSNLFSEKDCLDMLSLLSHLFRRLDNSELKQQQSKNVKQ